MVMILKWRPFSGVLALSKDETWRISAAVNGSRGCFEVEMAITKVYISVRSQPLPVIVTHLFT